MTRDKLLAWVIKKVEGKYAASDLDISIRALDQFLDLDKSDFLNYETTLMEMATASDDEKPFLMKNFTDIERIMKKFCEYSHPGLLNTIPEPLFAGDNSRTWTLANLYRQAFHVVPDDVNLTRANPDSYKNAPNYVRQYLVIYKYRNALTHELVVDFSDEYISDLTCSMLVITLHLCKRHHSLLAKEHNRVNREKIFDGTALALQIQKNYNALVKDGFGYVDMHWLIQEKQENSEYSIDSVITMPDCPAIKFLGEAGIGKSTALRRVEYLLAKNHLANPRVAVPIYVELGALGQSEHPILNEVADIMNITPDEAEDFLTCGEIALLLDGFNEVLETNLKRQIAKEIDAFFVRYPDTRIFLTDRALVSSGIPTLSKAKKLYLKPITMEDRKTYFEKNCKDSYCLQLIKERFESNPDYFEGLDSPLKLKQLLETILANRELPLFYIPEYIKTLLEREADEKKDPNVEYLVLFLQGLTVLDTDEYAELQVLMQFAKVKTLNGFSVPDTKRCLDLAIEMRLLVREENNRIRFAQPEYYDYFCMEAMANGLDEMLR